MTPKARKSLELIRRCVDDGRYFLTPHFTERLDQRGLQWADVMTILDDPTDVRDGGREKLDRPKWIVSGVADDGERIEMVCVLDVDEHGRLTVFVTIY